MKIICFGVDVSFGYDQVGGTDSFFRRLGLELAGRGHEIEFVHYGCARDSARQPAPNLALKEFKSFGSALRYLAGSQSVILVNAVRARDRLRFMRFRRRSRRAVYMVYSLYSETAWRRFLHFLEARLYPYQPGVLCMSPRLCAAAERHGQRAYNLLPPVPRDCFVDRDAKAVGRPRVVTYIGRMEPGKGGEEAVAVMEALASEPGVETAMSIYTLSGRELPEEIETRLGRIGNLRLVRRRHAGWSPLVEQEIAADLAGTDFLLLPYRAMSSSIDTPLLLLEGMAALCCVLSRPLGEVPRVYGPSRYLVDEPDFVAGACRLIRETDDAQLLAERDRIGVRNRELKFDTPAIADRLIEILAGQESMT